MSPFENIGNVPFDVAFLTSLFPECKHINEKARKLESQGRIIRLKKGMYVTDSRENNSVLCRELIANHIYGPSYVSMETALRHYGLIPERVYLIKSMTIKHSRDFENPTGNYSYQSVDKDYFPIGIRMEQEDSGASNRCTYLIASPEKALCDLINYSKNLRLRFMTDVESYLEDDIRFDTESLSEFDMDILEKCAEHSRRPESIKSLIKYIKNGRYL